MLKDTDYLGASARLRVAEGKGTASERLDAMLASKDIETLKNVLSDTYSVSPELSVDDMIGEILKNSVSIVKETVPDISVFAPLLFKYDCNNAKVVIKSIIIGNEYDSLISDLSLYDRSNYTGAFSTKDFSFLPGHMSKACGDALNEYNLTSDGQAVDSIMDKACFSDMKETAEKGGVELIKRYCIIQADTVNIRSSLRINNLKIDPSVAKSLFLRMFVPGGDIGEDVFVNEDNGLCTPEKMCMGMNYGPLYQAVSDIASKNITSASEQEKMLDEVQLKEYAGYKFSMFGAEMVAVFLLTKEAEVRNARRIASALRNGYGSQTIIGKVHVGYC